MPDIAKEKKAQTYEAYVKEITPPNNLPDNMIKAFLTGGCICTSGQFILFICRNLGVDRETSGIYCSIILIFFSVLLTSFNLYNKIGNFGGAGALVPITGFANSVAASAIEYQTEGQIFGIGCKIFTIAGPVILYGIFCSWVLALVYYCYLLFGGLI